MLIRKTYNIRQLKDELGEKIECARESCTGAAVVDVIIAQEILEVLEETFRREQKHQTLESALTFLEMEDGTQTNLQELSEKQREENIINGMKEEMDCFGNFNRRDECCVTCSCAILCRENTEVVEGETKESTKVPKCFGKYTTGESWERNCEYCGREVDCYLKSCKKECFGKYDKLSSECEDCEFVNECVIAKEAKQNE